MRVWRLLTATALAVGVVTTPAFAESSGSCPFDGSTRVFTANGGDLKLWVYQPSATEVHVCFAETVIRPQKDIGGDIVVRGPGVTPPSIVTNDTTCPQQLDITDPVALHALRLQVSTDPFMICVGTAVGDAVMVTMPGSGPLSVSPEVWVDKDSRVGFVYCVYVAPESPACRIWENDLRIV